MPESPDSSESLEQILLTLSPQSVAAQLQHLDGFIFLDSSGNHPTRQKQVISIIAALPQQTISGNLSDTTELELAIAKHKVDANTCQLELPNGGAFGWIDYDSSFHFGIYTDLLIFDHKANQWWSRGLLVSHLENSPESKTSSNIKIGEFSSNLTKLEYVEKVQRVKEYIAAGDIYQVNLTQRFRATVEAHSLYPLYQQLRESSPAPMAAYLKLGHREILSSSPETFLRLKGRRVSTFPIKGTSPRFHQLEKDQASIDQLTSSEKEISELIMITDLLRNDIGQVCEFGSVSVPQLTELETFEQVFHLVSKVIGTLNDDITHLDAVKACYPGGSITGAPKIRATEIIDELETVPRGLYTGAVGYLGFNDISQFNIVIRTLVKEGDNLDYHVGAGIVADSDPEHEYAETLQKAKGIKLALEG